MNEEKNNNLSIYILIASLVLGGALIYRKTPVEVQTIQLPEDTLIAFRCDVGVEGNPCDQAYAEGFRWGLAQIPLQVGLWGFKGGVDSNGYCCDPYEPTEDDLREVWNYIQEFSPDYYIHGGGLYPNQENYPLSFGK